VHAFGAVMIVLGVLFLVASKVPERNLLIVNIAILRFALGIVAQVWTYIQMHGLGLFWWINMVVDAILLLWLLGGRVQLMKKLA
jgi:hypothetical protein